MYLRTYLRNLIFQINLFLVDNESEGLIPLSNFVRLDTQIKYFTNYIYSR